MKITFLNPQGNFDPQDSYWAEHPDFGGQLVYVKEVAIAIANLGHNVDIITRQIIDPEWPEFTDPADTYPGMETLRILRIPCGPKRFLAKEELWPYLETEWVPNILSLYRSEGFEPDAFTTHYADGGLCGALISQQKGIPFTFTGHSLGAQKMDKLNASPTNLAELNERFKFVHRIIAERISMNYAGRIITSTLQERMEQYGHRVYHSAIDPVDENRFAAIPPGVNRRIFSPETTQLDQQIDKRINAALERDIPTERRHLPLVLASSRLDAKKNHIGLVKAFGISQELQTHANLAIAVRGLKDPLHHYEVLSSQEKTIMDGVVTMLNKHHLWNKVTAFSLDSQAELAAAYRQLASRRSVFALTALYEPFGLAPLEAMSCGLPVVVTKNGGPSESLVEGDHQFASLVDPADPEDIARGLLEVVASSAKWEHLQKSGIERVISKYTWERTAEGYIKVMEHLQKASPSAGALEIPPWFKNPSKHEIPLKTLEELYL